MRTLWCNLAAAFLVLCAVAAYCNSFAGPFVHDDVGSTIENPTIERLWPIGPVLSPPTHGQTVSGRPLLNLSLAVNYAIGGWNVRGYHAANLAIHIAATLLLFSILRRTLLSPTLRDRFGKAALPLATASAAIWAVHPLQTESVTYIVQRAESLAGLFYLLTLYCTIRGAGTAPFFVPQRSALPNSAAGEKGDGALQNRRQVETLSSVLWYAAAVLACLLGMATKEVMATAPLIVLLYDRTFLGGSFAEALRRRWPLYVGLAAGWILLVYLMRSTGLVYRQDELGAPPWWQYAWTQPAVILHYVRLSIWPQPLTFDYAWPAAKTISEIVPAALALGLLATAILWGLLRHKAWGFLGAWFLLILAPTSSILPLAQLAFEHRMYLSLAAVAVGAVVGGYALWDRLLAWSDRRHLTRTQCGHLAGVTKPTPLHCCLRWSLPVLMWAGVLLALASATVVRNRVYQSPLVFYQDTVNKRPDNPLARNNLGNSLARLGRFQESIEHYRRALAVRPIFAPAHDNLGNALFKLGKVEEALAQYGLALEQNPQSARAHNNLAFALASLGRTKEAIEHYRLAVRLAPNKADIRYNLAMALAAAEKVDEAIAQYREALRIRPDYAEVHNDLGNALAAVNRSDEAIAQFREALRLKGDYADACYNLGSLLDRLGKRKEAAEYFRRTLELRSDSAPAHNNLGAILAAAGNFDEAIVHYRAALRLRPDFAKAHNNLGNALLATGKVEEAIAQYLEALRLKTDYPAARYNLGNALVRAGKREEAAAQYREALRLQSDYLDARYNLASLLQLTGQAVEAIEQWQELLRRKPELVDARYKLASLLTLTGQTKEAIQQYERCLQQQPKSLEILNDLAWLLATRQAAEGGEPRRAVELAERARDLGGQQNAACLDTLAAAYAAAGRFDDATATAQQAAHAAASVGHNALAEKIQSRLDRYRAGQPYREPAEPPK